MIFSLTRSTYSRAMLHLLLDILYIYSICVCVCVCLVYARMSIEIKYTYDPNK